MSIPDRSSPAALVTGAARGIGRATAEALASAGWRVFAGVRDPDQLEPFGVEGIAVLHMDVTDADSVRAAVDRAEVASHGALGCVVNNAGWPLFGAVEDVDLDIARRQFETNLFGPAAVLQAALPAMRRAGRGVVVNVSTLSGRIPLPLFGMYSASKLALAAISDALALELAPAGIRVVLIEAGVVRTELARSTVISGSAAEADSPYSRTRDRVLGTLRAIREDAGLEADEVAAAIVRAARDDTTPFRLVLADAGLLPLADAIGGPDPAAHALVRGVLGLDDSETPDAAS